MECALVRDEDRTGLFCTSDLRDALLSGKSPGTIAVREVAVFDGVTLHQETLLIEALRLMVRDRRSALTVVAGGRALGILSRADVACAVVDPAHRLMLQIAQAGSIDDLQAVAGGIDAMVTLLHKEGSRIERIAGLVGELNSRLFDRAWTIVAPTEVQRDSCLIIMGSEGRGEQIVKSDQDNALLLRDGHGFESLESVAQRFNAALTRFGYPPCPGDLMLTNVLWRQSLADFKQTLRRWLFGADPEGVMNVAMFLDARAVSGDPGLLQQAQRFVHDSVVDSDAFFARFARAAVQFEPEVGWWTRLIGRREDGQRTIDLKKLGTFPIVHGVRALALQHRIVAVNTADRLLALAERGVLSATMSRDLVDALRFMMSMRMQVNLHQRTLGLPFDNRVQLSELSALERSMLKGSLAAIGTFRQYLHRHFKLDAL